MIIIDKSMWTIPFAMLWILIWMDSGKVSWFMISCASTLSISRILFTWYQTICLWIQRWSSWVLLGSSILPTMLYHSCFAKWMLNFMQGAGHIDGEILEMLWSGMNKISGAARSMSKAHRQETLDDCVRDANWKKTVGVSEFFSSHNGLTSHIVSS